MLFVPIWFLVISSAIPKKRRPKSILLRSLFQISPIAYEVLIHGEKSRKVVINLVILRIFLEISIDMIDIQLSPPSPNLKFLRILRKCLVEPLLQESMDQIRAWAVKDTSCQSSGDSVTGDDKGGYQKLHPGNVSEMVVTGQEKTAGSLLFGVAGF